MTETEKLDPYAKEFKMTIAKINQKDDVRQKVLENADIKDTSERHWCSSFTDLFNWWSALWHVQDEDLKDICGVDYALYLIFLRYTSQLLLLITVFNMVIMVPLYVTGEPMESDDYRLLETISDMTAGTILNVTANRGKMIFAYFCAVFLIPSLAFGMIYQFRRRYYRWKKKPNPTLEFRDNDMARFAVEVRNLPIDEGVESL